MFTRRNNIPIITNIGNNIVCTVYLVNGNRIGSILKTTERI